MKLTDKVVVITGAYSGFGLALAEKLASRKCKLLISGRDEAKLKEVSENLGRQTSVVAIKADVTKVRDCKRLIDTCIKSYGKIDIMINNAGVLEDGMKPRIVDELIDVNLKGLEYCSYYAILQMKKQEDGGILVNISSTSGMSIRPREEGAVYQSSKFGVVAYSGALHLSHKDSKIRIMCFCPGGMKTNLFRKNPEKLLKDFIDPNAAANILLKQLDMERYGLVVLQRNGLLQYSKDFSLSWAWNSEEQIDLNSS